MKLSKHALEALKDRKLRLSMALELKFSEVWIDKLIEQNKENGPLTTVKAVMVFKNETKMKDDQILEEKKAAIKA